MQISLNIWIFNVKMYLIFFSLDNFKTFFLKGKDKEIEVDILASMY